MSRRDQIQMSPQEVQDFLRNSRTLILCSIGREGFPHPMPMWFVLDPDGSVRMTTYAKSQKVRNLRRDPRVALLAESGETYAELRGVVLEGRAEILEDVALAQDTMLRASGQDPDRLDPEALAKARSAVEPMARKRVVIRCKPERVVSWDHARLGGRY